MSNHQTPGAAPTPPVATRWDEIDWLKGLAIIGVLLIHSQPLLNTWGHSYIINRSVSIFLTLFGVTSTLWWERASARSPGTVARQWYTTRLWRLMVPVWGTIVVWWTMVVVLRAPDVLTPEAVVASALGYLPSAGTAWFITVILQLVLVFPALYWAVRRLGAVIMIGATAFATLESHWHCLAIMDVGRDVMGSLFPADEFSVFWMFIPQQLVLVVSGIVVARDPRLLSPGSGAVALAIFLVGAYVHQHHAVNVHFNCSTSGLQRLMDVPLTIALLSLLRQLARGGAPLGWLAQCGLASWGLYLGQMLIHESVRLVGWWPEDGPEGERWAYFALLLIGAWSLVAVGERLRQWPGRLAAG